MQENNTVLLLKTIQSHVSAKPARHHHLLWETAQGNIYIRMKLTFLLLV